MVSFRLKIWLLPVVTTIMLSSAKCSLPRCIIMVIIGMFYHQKIHNRTRCVWIAKQKYASSVVYLDFWNTFLICHRFIYVLSIFHFINVMWMTLWSSSFLLFFIVLCYYCFSVCLCLKREKCFGNRDCSVIQLGSRIYIR